MIGRGFQAGLVLALMFGAPPSVEAQPDIPALKSRAADGDAEAAYTLGRAYKLGDSVAADNHEAERWFARAARLGHAKASVELGLVLHQNGRSGEALPWLRKAAEAGDPRAEYTLGTILYAGKAVPADADQARRWMRKAAKAGLPAATEALAVMDGAASAPAVAAVPLAVQARWQAQLGAFSVAANASAYWQKLRGSEASGLQASFPVRDGLTLLRVGPFASRGDARRFCATQRERGRDCMEVASRTD